MVGSPATGLAPSKMAAALGSPHARGPVGFEPRSRAGLRREHHCKEGLGQPHVPQEGTYNEADCERVLCPKRRCCPDRPQAQ